MTVQNPEVFTDGAGEGQPPLLLQVDEAAFVAEMAPHLKAIEEDVKAAVRRAVADALPGPTAAPDRIERRVKVLRLPASLVLDWFTTAVKGWPRCVALPKLTGLPDGLRVLSVRESFPCRTFDFLVAHESFDLVAEGDCPPELGAGPLGLEFEVIELPDGGADADSYKLNPGGQRC